MQRVSFAVPGVVAAVLLLGCGDEVVGYFDATTGGAASSESSSTGVPSPTTDSTGTTSTATTGDTTTSGPGDPGFVPPGCFGDDFENAVIDPLWNTWIEEDAELVEAEGMLKLTPPSFGVWDTGVIGAYNYVFPFTDGHVRVRVPLPADPSRPVLLFLTVGEEASGMTHAMMLTGGEVRWSTALDLIEQTGGGVPSTPYPMWLQIRAEGSMVHFETSEDGNAFTTLATGDKVAAFDVTYALIMAQTYGEDLDRSPIGVDDFEVCVQ